MDLLENNSSEYRFTGGFINSTGNGGVGRFWRDDDVCDALIVGDIDVPIGIDVVGDNGSVGCCCCVPTWASSSISIAIDSIGSVIISDSFQFGWLTFGHNGFE